MGYTMVCKNCNEPSGKKTRLIMREGGNICLECIVALTTTSGVPSRLDKFVVWFRDTKMRSIPLKEQNDMLIARLERMEKMLAEVKTKYGVELNA